MAGNLTDLSPPSGNGGGAGRGDRNGESERPDLCREFVELLISEAAECSGDLDPERIVRVVGWDTVWAKCQGMESVERAKGRVVLLADELAAVIAPGTGATRLVLDTSTRSPAADMPSTLLVEPEVTSRPYVVPPPVPIVPPPPPPPPPVAPAVVAPAVVAPAPPPPPPVAPAVVAPAVVAPAPPPVAPAVVAPAPPPPLAPAVVAPAPPPPLAPAVVAPAPPPPLAPAVVAPITAGGRLSESRRQRMADAATWVRNIGVLVILFAAWQVWGTSIGHSHAQASLRSQFSAEIKARGISTTDTLVPASVRLVQPPEGTVVAHLVIPAIGVDQYVVQGTAETDLSMGPGHYIGTAMPGQEGNLAIAGHRTTYGAPFNELNELTLGDPVYVTTKSGEKLTYVVSQAPVAVAPTDVAVLNDAGDNRLTLTTCNPKFSATQRLVVVAELSQPKGPTHHQARVAKVVVGSTGWNLQYLPEVALIIVFLVGLGLEFKRIRRHLGPARWLVLGPLWVCGIYFLFVALSAFLPATL
jgi:sortase A